MAKIKFNFYNVYNMYYRNINESVYYFNLSLKPSGVGTFTILLEMNIYKNKTILFQYFEELFFYTNKFQKKILRTWKNPRHARFILKKIYNTKKYTMKIIKPIVYNMLVL